LRSQLAARALPGSILAATATKADSDAAVGKGRKLATLSFLDLDAEVAKPGTQRANSDGLVAIEAGASTIVTVVAYRRLIRR
jgi:hypothetical protein